VSVIDSASQSHEIEVVVDTGFNGSLTLSQTLIAEWGLPWDSVGTGTLADGKEIAFPVHRTKVLWDGQLRSVFVEALEGSPLLGTELLSGFDLRARIHPGGLVEIEAIP
jgi:clan AA aspartic protease